MDFSHLTVLCVGDVMLDRFLHGDVERISPEAPVPVIRLRETREMLGGAGNVANNIASLGGEAVLVGLVGDDEPGARSRTRVGEARIVPALVHAAPADHLQDALRGGPPAGRPRRRGEPRADRRKRRRR